MEESSVMRYSFLLLLLAVFGAYCQEKDPITFDGQLNPQEWENASTYDIGYEIDPGNNDPAPYKTKVYIKYSEQYLWVGFDAEADPSTLRSALRNRDEAFQDDIVMIGIDTYGDGRYMIAVGCNAEGSQVDLKFLANGNDDDSYDVSFESKASKTATGYHVELKIPFQIFQFKNQPKLNWKVLFYRSTYVDGKRSQNFSFPIDRNNSCFPCQATDALVLENIKPKRRVNFLPYVFTGLSGTRTDQGLKYGKTNFDAGLSGLLDLSNVTSLEYTLNPDFSQVEADVSQIDANSAFALYFPERRAYFNEGNDLITTNLETVYTRSINQPVISTKLIHQGEKQRVYWLTAYDTKTAYLIGDENGSYFGEGKENVSNILRYQRTFEQGAHIGFLTTNRFLKGGGYDNTVGLTGQFRFLKSYTTSFEYNKSFTLEPEQDWIEEENLIKDYTAALDGEKFNGDGIQFSLERNTEHWNSGLYYQQTTPLYRTPLGFTVQNALKGLELEHYYQQFYKGFLKQMNIGGELELRYNDMGLRKYAGVELSGFFQIAGNVRTQLRYSHAFNEEFKGFNPARLNSFSWWVGINPMEAVRINLFTEIGESIGYNLDDPAVGRSFFFGTFDNFQINDNFRISPSLRYEELRNKEDDSLYYKGYIARANLNYQFNNDLSLRLVGEYNDFDKGFFVQPLLQWNPNPFTIFYIGGSSGYSRIENANRFSIESSQFYMKFQYLIGI